MTHSLKKAREVLASLPRCGAKSRQTGEPCKLPGLGAGGRCRFHGGRSTGRPPTHGRKTKKAQLECDWLRMLLGILAAAQEITLHHFKPGRIKPERLEQVLQAKLNPSRHGA